MKIILIDVSHPCGAKGLLRTASQSSAKSVSCATTDAETLNGSIRVRVNKISNIGRIRANFAKFWRARSRLYQNEFLQQNMRLTVFLKLYNICILLHSCNLKILAKNSV